ncbi:unnamed protein product, partial [Strongylus vulgaris]
MLTTSELSFLRLLERTKKLAREDLIANVWKVNAAVIYLENLFNRLQDEKRLNVQQRHVDAVWERAKPTQASSRCGKLRELISFLSTLSFPMDAYLGVAPQQTEIASEVRLRNRTVYRADLRKQLLGEQAKRREEMSDDLMKHEEKQESLANELLSLTKSLKHNMSIAGNVLKDDNK